MRRLNLIVIHCSDSAFGDAKIIDEWHKERGWEGIGYHFVILNGYIVGKDVELGTPVPAMDGVVQRGREVKEVGVHAKGHNDESIGVCLIGLKTFTGRQLDALVALVLQLRKDYGSHLKVVGHCELDPAKTCPNLDMDYFRENFLT